MSEGTTALVKTSPTANAMAVYEKIANPLEAAEKMGKWVASSGIFGKNVDPGTGALIAFGCFCTGTTIWDFQNTYHLVPRGESAGGGMTPTMKADAMLAAFNKAGGIAEWHEVSPTRCSATFQHPDPKRGKIPTITVTIEQASAPGGIGVSPKTGKPKPAWTTDPESMLHKAVIRIGIRRTMPEVIAGPVWDETDAAEAADNIIDVPVSTIDDGAGTHPFVPQPEPVSAPVPETPQPANDSEPTDEPTAESSEEDALEELEAAFMAEINKDPESCRTFLVAHGALADGDSFITTKKEVKEKIVKKPEAFEAGVARFIEEHAQSAADEAAHGGDEDE